MAGTEPGRENLHEHEEQTEDDRAGNIMIVELCQKLCYPVDEATGRGEVLPEIVGREEEHLVLFLIVDQLPGSQRPKQRHENAEEQREESFPMSSYYLHNLIVCE